ncbi:tetratricopeptide repeat protein [Psychrobacter sp. I-STPA10]|uniref:tetratricopeptide repeat protein n=1 Tax=Psychrobacter sp. I-STPA10 TaxID=2585769 RepID=UPI001E3AD3F4|nr:hypothetical protein [Psychrobacter sp. I-STPA10]
MSVSNISTKTTTSRLFISGLFMSTLGMMTAAQADETQSPYIQLYQNSVNNPVNNINNNTATATATNTNPPKAPAARITSTRTIRPAANTSAQTTNTTNITPTIATNTELQQAEPIVRVSNSIRYRENTETNSIDLLSNNLPQIPTPQLSVSDISYVPTILIPQTQNSNAALLDVSLLDDFINEINPHARHYPPNFDNISQRYNSKIKLKELEAWLRPYADAPNASYEVLLRATKLNSIGRNLDLGSDFVVRASTYVTKAIERQPNSAEANFLYGMMLSEGGGFKAGRKYLDKAAAQGYLEAEQSLAQTDLLTDQRSQALERLRRLSIQNPNNRQLQQQINIIENGDYYIWNLPTN